MRNYRSEEILDPIILRGRGNYSPLTFINANKVKSNSFLVKLWALLCTIICIIRCPLSLTSHIDTSMTCCQSITKILRIIWVRCIQLRLRSKTRRRATPLLPTWIYSCRSRVTVSCALSFTTNVTISTSISQTFRS